MRMWGSSPTLFTEANLSKARKVNAVTGAFMHIHCYIFEVYVLKMLQPVQVFYSITGCKSPEVRFPSESFISAKVYVYVTTHKVNVFLLLCCIDTVISGYNTEFINQGTLYIT